jgi:hypothetical protein
MAFSGRPGGQAPLSGGPRPDAVSPAPQAGTGPRGQGSLYTVCRDLDDHGCLDVLGSRDLDGYDDSDVRGERLALGCCCPCGFLGVTCHLGPRPCGDAMGGRATPDLAVSVGTCGGRAARPKRVSLGGRFNPALTASVGTCGGRATRPAAREGRDRPDGA